MTSTRVADRYSLDQEIGRGGSAAVWLGRDEILGRPVALKKVGLPPGSASPDLVRAEREARLAARVNHPNVVAVFDLVEETDSQWLVMEYVDGMTLARMIRERGPLPPSEVASILAQVADALAAAHQVSIVHRDVKPSNILVGHDGQAKLSDFGIARAVADATLTQTGLVTGSPAYLSPEVASGSTATQASDVWSLGATMYHALAGHPPFAGDGDSNAVLGILYRIVHEDPPRLRAAGWLGPLLEAAMTRDPAGRPTMKDVAEYLHARPGEPEHDSTLVMTAASAAPARPSPAPPARSTQTSAVPPAPAGPDSAPGRPRRTGSGRPVLIGGAVVALLAALGAALLVTTSGDDEPGGTTASSTQDAGRADGASGADPGSDSPTSPSPDQPTAQDLEGFAATYLQTASSDPAAGYEMLTPEFQRASNGFDGYEEFWGDVSNVEVLNVKGDPSAMTVSYTYKYDYPGVGNRTERVTLRLAQVEGELRIADEL